MTVQNRAGFIRSNILSSATLTADVEVSGYPVTNVLDSLHYERWRADATSATLAWDHGSGKSFDTLVIRFRSNRDPSESVTASVASSDEFTLKLSDVSVSGSELFSETYNFNVDAGLGYHTLMLPSAETSRYGSIDFSLASRSGEGFFEIEEIQMGTTWYPSQNYQTNSDDTEDTQSFAEYSDLSAATFTQSRARREAYERAWEMFTEAEYEEWRSFRRTHGITKRFVYINRTSASYLPTNVIIGRWNAPLITRRGLEGHRYFVRGTIIENR